MSTRKQTAAPAEETTTAATPDPLRAKMEKRRAELKAEMEQGHKMMAEMDARRAQLAETLLRISGALQVLEESLGEPPAQ